MAARSRAIEARLERMAPAMHEYFVTGILTKEEHRETAKARTNHEYKLIARPLLLIDVRNAIEFELRLDSKIEAYAVRTKMQLKHRWDVLDRVDGLYKLSLPRLRDHEERQYLEDEYIAFLKRTSRSAALSRFLAERLQASPQTPRYWVLAAEWEAVQGNIADARATVQRGTEAAGRFPALWACALRVELLFVQQALDGLRSDSANAGSKAECVRNENAALGAVLFDLQLAQIVLETAFASPAAKTLAALVETLVSVVVAFPFASPLLPILVERALAGAVHPPVSSPSPKKSASTMTALAAADERMHAGVTGVLKAVAAAWAQPGIVDPCAYVEGADPVPPPSRSATVSSKKRRQQDAEDVVTLPTGAAYALAALDGELGESAQLLAACPPLRASFAAALVAWVKTGSLSVAAAAPLAKLVLSSALPDRVAALDAAAALLRQHTPSIWSALAHAFHRGVVALVATWDGLPTEERSKRTQASVLPAGPLRTVLCVTEQGEPITETTTNVVAEPQAPKASSSSMTAAARLALLRKETRRAAIDHRTASKLAARVDAAAEVEARAAVRPDRRRGGSRAEAPSSRSSSSSTSSDSDDDNDDGESMPTASAEAVLCLREIASHPLPSFGRDGGDGCQTADRNAAVLAVLRRFVASWTGAQPNTATDADLPAAAAKLLVRRGARVAAAVVGSQSHAIVATVQQVPTGTAKNGGGGAIVAGALLSTLGPALQHVATSSDAPEGVRRAAIETCRKAYEAMYADVKRSASEDAPLVRHLSQCYAEFESTVARRPELAQAVRRRFGADFKAVHG